jgi:predicted PurR-regulated permease PerM
MAWFMDSKAIAARTLVQAAVVALVALSVWAVLRGTQVFLVAFAGILLAVLLRTSANWLSAKTPLTPRWGLAIVVVAPLLLAAAAIWLLAPDIAKQASALADRLPEAVRQLKDQLARSDWAGPLMAQKERLQDALPGIPGASDAFSASSAFGMAGRAFSTTFGALGNLVIVLAIGLFLAIAPQAYIGGLLRLLPLHRRARARQVLAETSSALASWLLAKLTAMVVIGVLTAVGLSFIGIDLALVLALLAALLSFIPNIGPVIAVVPAALIAMVVGIDKLGWVIALYVAVQAFESYVLTPVLQQKLLDLPPALTLSVQVLLGVLAGALGVILATPLTVALMTMTRMWYVEDILGDHGKPGTDSSGHTQGVVRSD